MWKQERPLLNCDEAFNVKLAPRFASAIEIRRIISSVIVDLRDEQEKWYRHIHVQDLKSVSNEPEDSDSNGESNKDAT